MTVWFTEAVAAIAREAHARMMQDPFSAFYLYFKPHGLRFCVVREDEPREGLELVTGERIPSHLTCEALTARFALLCARVPVLPKTRPVTL